MDYYGLEDKGCCLICPNGYDGCLCYKCKCRKCDNYERTPYGGHCQLIEQFKQERREAKWYAKREAKWYAKLVQQKKYYPPTNQQTISGKPLRKNTPQFIAYENRKVKK